MQGLTFSLKYESMCTGRTVPSLPEEEWQENQSENVSESTMDTLPIGWKEKKQEAPQTSH